MIPEGEIYLEFPLISFKNYENAFATFLCLLIKSLVYLSEWKYSTSPGVLLTHYKIEFIKHVFPKLFKPFILLGIDTILSFEIIPLFYK